MTGTRMAAALALALSLAAPAAAASRFELISVDSGETPGNEWSYASDVSADGRYVLFWSGATNLARKGEGQLYLRDRRRGRTRVVSRSSTGAFANRGADNGSLSPNGRFLAFCSVSTNLAEPDRFRALHPLERSERFTDVFVRDLTRGITRRASTTYRGGMANGPSCTRRVADNGDVVFGSRAGNLVRRDGDKRWDQFHYSWEHDRLRMIRVVSDRRSRQVPIGGTALSGNGKVTTVTVPTTDRDARRDRRFYIHLLRSGRTTVLRPPRLAGIGVCGDFRTSRSGRYIAATCDHVRERSDGSWRTGGEHIYRYDRRTKRWKRLTPGPAYGAPDEGLPDAGGWDVSENGRFVAWCSLHQFGLEDDTNYMPDLYVRNVVSGRWERVTGGPGQPPGGDCGPLLAEGGRVVALSTKTAYLRKDRNEDFDAYLMRRPLRS